MSDEPQSPVQWAKSILDRARQNYNQFFYIGKDSVLGDAASLFAISFADDERGAYDGIFIISSEDSGLGLARWEDQRIVDMLDDGKDVVCEINYNGDSMVDDTMDVMVYMTDILSKPYNLPDNLATKEG